MKKLFYYMAFVCIAVTVMTACKEMDTTYKEYLVVGGITYPGRASSPEIYTGRNRVKITWSRGTDQSVTKARIYWNNYSDSVEVAIHPDDKIISKTIENLPEGTYTFVIKTFDAANNSSVPVELLSAVYGDTYQEGLLFRPIKTSVRFTDKIEVEWGAANISGGAYATEIKYIDESDQERIKRFLIDEELSVISDIKPGTSYEYRTAYLPQELSIDTFYTDFQPNQYSSFHTGDWKIKEYSSFHPDAANPTRNVPENFIDGDPTTRWHTNASAPVPGYPHFVVIDMQSAKTITAIELFRSRITSNDRNNGSRTFQLSISNDGVNFTPLGGVMNFDSSIDDGQFYQVSAPFAARYLEFRGLSGAAASMSMGDMSVFGN